ncbi:hypothetical protein DFH08DRAFT_808536 [Mycena albidolilacea]|uniref:Uncharacterized protein n=1 Tax=Mycena albidolilacea TaxID=1033008 RepID=A0AAD7A1M4_9AGAR|nr:hypothetical protein DFH08DRAFT_808536 [Mycena albidolilacea]
MCTCDASDILQSSALIWMLSLIPAKIFPYLALGLLSASFIIYALRHNCPAVRVDRLKNGITVVDEILTHAKAKCMRNYLALVEAETRFLRTKLAVSKIHSRLLEACHMPGWKIYLRDIFTISRALAMLEREVRDIQTSLLVLIEADHQHKLTVDLHAGQEIGDGVLQPQYSDTFGHWESNPCTPQPGFGGRARIPTPWPIDPVTVFSNERAILGIRTKKRARSTALSVTSCCFVMPHTVCWPR